MASTSETRHAKNIANFQDLISFCQGYGTAYNPAKNSLTIAQLQAAFQLAQTKLNTAKTEKALFDNATNARRNQYSNLKPYVTKIVNAYAVSGADPLSVDDIKAVNKKLQGTRSNTSNS